MAFEGSGDGPHDGPSPDPSLKARQVAKLLIRTVRGLIAEDPDFSLRLSSNNPWADWIWDGRAHIPSLATGERRLRATRNGGRTIVSLFRREDDTSGVVRIRDDRQVHKDRRAPPSRETALAEIDALLRTIGPIAPNDGGALAGRICAALLQADGIGIGTKTTLSLPDLNGHFRISRWVQGSHLIWSHPNPHNGGFNDAAARAILGAGAPDRSFETWMGLVDDCLRMTFTITAPNTVQIDELDAVTAMRTLATITPGAALTRR